MTGKELLQYQLNTVGHQINKCIEGLDESQVDAKANEQSMSAKETLIHLTECYLASQAALRGEDYAWGSYQAPDSSWAAVLGAFQSTRGNTVHQVIESTSDKALRIGTDYMALHDAYHVGQMVTLRLTLTPDWNSYSIYEG